MCNLLSSRTFSPNPNGSAKISLNANIRPISTVICMGNPKPMKSAFANFDNSIDIYLPSHLLHFLDSFLEDRLSLTTSCRKYAQKMRFALGKKLVNALHVLSGTSYLFFWRVNTWVATDGPSSTSWCEKSPFSTVLSKLHNILYTFFIK